MSRRHAASHGRHRGLAPALWVAAVVVALFITSLGAIVLLILRVTQILIEVAGYAWPAP